MKGYSAFSKAPALLKPHHQIVLWSYTGHSLLGVLSLCRDAVGVFYILSRLDNANRSICFIDRTPGKSRHGNNGIERLTLHYPVLQKRSYITRCSLVSYTGLTFGGGYTNRSDNNKRVLSFADNTRKKISKRPTAVNVWAKLLHVPCMLSGDSLLTRGGHSSFLQV